MHITLATLIDRLDSGLISRTNVIRWSCPVPSFGDITRSRVATLGLNPSSREFMDEAGNELEGPLRRFHTLASLRLRSWSDVDARHLRLITESCHNYFLGNPYNRWFKRLEQVVCGARASFYSTLFSACHLDLIPYATVRKWAELPSQQRSYLLSAAGETLGLLLRESPIRVLILNGRSVVENFQALAGVELEKQEMPAWSLRRQMSADVKGVAYKGIIESFSGLCLGRTVMVLGFNHNLQSSFGVTTHSIKAIRDWIGEESAEVIE